MNRLGHFSEPGDARTPSRAWAWPSLLVALFASAFAVAPYAQGTGNPPAAPGAAPRPIRALYVTGGGFHEFVKQEAILPPAVAERVKVEWTIDHSAGTSTEVMIDRHKDTNWTKDFDVVLYNMSFSHVVDVPWIERLAHAHRDSGVGAVILHGAVHSYRRSESRAWGELTGAFSLRHDSQRPHSGTTPRSSRTPSPSTSSPEGCSGRWASSGTTGRLPRDTPRADRHSPCRDRDSCCRGCLSGTSVRPSAARFNPVPPSLRVGRYGDKAVQCPAAHERIVSDNDAA